MFLDREEELSELEGRWRKGKPELAILYGRRRVGKTALLREFAAGKPHAFFLAARTREEDSLRQVSLVLAEATGDEVLTAQPFTSWEGFFAYLVALGRRKRFGLILDEFPNLCFANPALPSILQTWWDGPGRATKLFLVLCGSQVGFMEESVLAERSPLFGRRTAQWKVGPLSPAHAGLFFPAAGPREKLFTYGIAGGIPAYLEKLSARRSPETALVKEAYSPSGFLFDEVSYLLKMELKEPATYMSLLLAIASGATRQTEIADRARLPVPSVNRYLQTLQGLGFVERRVPFLERAPEHSRKGLYFVSDPFVRFWCRFVLPYQSLIADRQGEEAYRRLVAPEMESFLGPVFEEVCRWYVLARWSRREGRLPVRVGSHWAPDLEIDLMAELDDGTFLAGECKVWRKRVGPAVLRDLEGKIGRLPADVGKRTRPALFSLAGFEKELVEEAKKTGTILVRGEDIFERK